MNDGSPFSFCRDRILEKNIKIPKGITQRMIDILTGFCYHIKLPCKCNFVRF